MRYIARHNAPRISIHPIELVLYAHESLSLARDLALSKFHPSPINIRHERGADELARRKIARESIARGIGGYYGSDFESRIAIPRVRRIMLWPTGITDRWLAKVASSYATRRIPPFSPSSLLPAPRARSRVHLSSLPYIRFQTKKRTPPRRIAGGERIL